MDLNKLEILARGATPGPWVRTEPDAFPWYRDGCGTRGENTLTILGAGGYGVFSVPESITDGPREKNVEYISAISPDVVLQLISALRKVVEETDGISFSSACDVSSFVADVLEDCGIERHTLYATKNGCVVEL